MVTSQIARERARGSGGGPGTAATYLSFTVLSLVVLVGLLLLGSVIAFEAYYADRIYPGIQVWDLDVGGMQPSEAAVALERELQLDAPMVQVSGAGLERAVRLSDLGLRLDAQATLAPAYRLGRSGPWTSNLLTHLELLVSSHNLPPVLVYNAQTARTYLEALADEVYIPPTDASLSLNGVTPVVSPANSGRKLDVEATLAGVFPAVRKLAPASVELVTRELPPAIADAEPARHEAEMLLASPLTLVIAEPREGDPGPWVLPQNQLVTMLMVRAENGTLHIAVNQEALRAYLQSIAPELVIEPVDARYHFNENGRQLAPISASQDGRALDVDSSLALIMQELSAGNHTVPLSLQIVPSPYPDTATAEQLGIVDLVAEGDSYFIGSPSARHHNIRLAATKFDGLAIPPGETFSFNEHLGEVSAEAGYDESYITAGEQLQIEVGGGICQVSTTAFRAAFWGGYPVEERWYHNNRIGYYELRNAGVGMDATVYSPYVDFKFVNDRPYPLLIETEIVDSEHRLIFRFYSTSDGRRVEKEGPTVGEPAKPEAPIYCLDKSVEAGKVKQWQTAVDGLMVTVGRKVYDAAGNPIMQDAFVSKYTPRRAAYHYGPGYVLPEGVVPADECTSR